MPPAVYRLRVDRIGEDLDYLEISRLDGSAAQPVVVLLHGHGGNKEKHLPTAYRYAARGFRVVAFDLRRHGSREGSETRDDEFQREPAATMSDIIAGSAADLSQLLDSLEISGVGIHGNSLGGITMFEAMCREPRIKVAVSVMGSPNRKLLASSLGMDTGSAHLRDVLSTSPHLTLGDVFPPRPLLMLHGAEDTLVRPEGVQELYKTMGAAYVEHPERLKLVVYPGIGHEATEPMLVSAVDWMEKFSEELIP